MSILSSIPHFLQEIIANGLPRSRSALGTRLEGSLNLWLFGMPAYGFLCVTLMLGSFTAGLLFAAAIFVVVALIVILAAVMEERDREKGIEWIAPEQGGHK